jgi:hypothetical protein
MTQIYADKTNKISVNQRHPRHLRSIKISTSCLILKDVF